MAKDNDREAWERQPGESGPAFEAFAAYRDMGEKRTISAVARQLNKSGTLCHRWKLKYDWRARADAYDASIAEEARKQAVSERKKMQDRHIKMSLQLQRKAMEALEKIKPEEMTPKDVKEFLRLATELERMNREESIQQQTLQLRREEFEYKKERDSGTNKEVEDLEEVEADVYGEEQPGRKASQEEKDNQFPVWG